MNPVEYINEFGLKTFLVCSSTRIARKVYLPINIINDIENYKYSYLIQWLEKRIGYEHRDSSSITQEKLSETDPIWVFWWQGIANAPNIVQVCVESIYRNAGDHPVILLDKENIEGYCTIPQGITEKVARGDISITHFSDVLRFALMSQTGGFWFDATIYMTGKIPEIAYKSPYFSLRGTFDIWPWTDFLQGSAKGNTFTTEVYNLILSYNIRYRHFVTYLLADTCMRCVYEGSSVAKSLVDAVPETDKSIFTLNDVYLDTPFNLEEWETPKNQSFAHKLSYKFSHSEVTNQELTYYGKLIRERRLP